MRTAQLERWLSEVSRSDDGKVASGAIRQARSAIDAASKEGAGAAEIGRAQSIAEAALVLAERRVALRGAVNALAAAEERVANIKERADAQRRVLEALMRERATLALAAEDAQ